MLGATDEGEAQGREQGHLSDSGLQLRVDQVRGGGRHGRDLRELEDFDA